MGFVGNYALCGLSPQTDGMPVIRQIPRSKLTGHQSCYGVFDPSSIWGGLPLLPLSYIYVSAGGGDADLSVTAANGSFGVISFLGKA